MGCGGEEGGKMLSQCSVPIPRLGSDDQFRMHIPVRRNPVQPLLQYLQGQDLANKFIQKHSY